jgi:hypothetical protein
MAVTLIDIKTLFETICGAHTQIKSFHFDYLDQIAVKKDIEYLAVLLAVESVDVYKSYNVFNFQLLALDKIDKALENDMIVLESTRQVLLDVIAEVELKSAVNMGIVNGDSISLEDVRDTFNDDIIAGWLTRISIRVPNTLDACGIPYILPPAVLLQENEFPILLE